MQVKLILFVITVICNKKYRRITTQWYNFIKWSHFFHKDRSQGSVGLWYIALHAYLTFNYTFCWIWFNPSDCVSGSSRWTTDLRRGEISTLWVHGELHLQTERPTWHQTHEQRSGEFHRFTGNLKNDNNTKHFSLLIF